MKCAICHDPIGDRALGISCFGQGGVSTATFCLWCARALLGASELRRVQAAVVKAGWTQPPLPYSGLPALD